MYDEDYFKNILRNIDNLGKINIPDFSIYSNVFDNIGKLNLPEPDSYLRALESVGKVNFPDPDIYIRALENFGKVNFPDPNRYIRALDNFGKMNFPNLENQQKLFMSLDNVQVPDFDKIYSIFDTISNFSNQFSHTDWDSFELTEISIKEANDILESSNPEEELIKEINRKKGIPDSIKTIIIYICLTIQLLADLITITEFTEEKIKQVRDYYVEHIADNPSKSDRESINWLKNELKKDISPQITQNFRIVTKNNIAVRTGRGIDTKIKGQLSHGDIVQILDKRKNWSFISFYNYKNGDVIEGWVFTRYLRQIK